MPDTEQQLLRIHRVLCKIDGLSISLPDPLLHHSKYRTAARLVALLHAEGLAIVPFTAPDLPDNTPWTRERLTALEPVARAALAEGHDDDDARPWIRIALSMIRTMQPLIAFEAVIGKARTSLSHYIRRQRDGRGVPPTTVLAELHAILQQTAAEDRPVTQGASTNADKAQAGKLGEVLSFQRRAPDGADRRARKDPPD